MPRANTEAMQVHLDEIAGAVSPGVHAVVLLDHVRAGRDGASDLVEMHLHGFGIGARHDDGGTRAAFRADGAKQISRGGAQILDRHRPAVTPRPAPRARVLLAKPHLVPEPHLERRGRRQRAHDLRQALGELFLKAARSPGF